MRQTLIILRGAPASGKTTIAENLRNFENKIVWFKTDNFKPFFSDRFGEGSAMDAVMETSLATLNYLLDQGYSIVFEGIFINPVYPQRAIQMGKTKNINTVVYQLECSLKTLQERDKTRRGVPEGLRKAMGDYEIENLNNKVKDNPIDGTIKLNTEEKSLEECINLIRNSFN
jgi:predicted kinase